MDFWWSLWMKYWGKNCKCCSFDSLFGYPWISYVLETEFTGIHWILCVLLPLSAERTNTCGLVLHPMCNVHSEWLNSLKAGDSAVSSVYDCQDFCFLYLIDWCYAFCFERHVGDKMENSMPTCFVLWMWQMCLRAPCLTNRAPRKLFGCWKRWKLQPVLSSWRLGIISHTSPSDTPRW